MTAGSRINDLLRCMLANAPGGLNLAAPAETVHQGRPLRRAGLWRDSLADRDDRVVITDWDGFKLRGLAAARALNGGRAWRIDRLHLAGPAPTAHLAGEKARWEPAAGLDLLEGVAQAAGQRGAERVFLRTPEGSPVASLAQRTGYFPCYQETHLRGRPERSYSDGRVAGNGDGNGHRLSALAPHEEYALFQLYCAATPQLVRDSIGLTFDQWRAGRELGGAWTDRSCPQWALRDGDRIIGWVSLYPCGRVGAAAALVRPERPEALAPLLMAAHSVPGEQSWLLADYQEPVAARLLRQGLREAGRYTMFVKTVAAPVIGSEYSLAEA